MLPCLPIYDALDSAYGNVISGGNSGLGIAEFRSCSNRENVRCGEFGGANRFSARQTMRIEARRIGIAEPKAPFGGGVPDVLPLRAKPEMRRITARGIIANMQHADACGKQLRLVGEGHVCRKLIGNPMCEADFPGPLHLAVAVAGVRPHKRPADLWGGNRYTAPETFGGDARNAGHSVTFYGGQYGC